MTRKLSGDHDSIRLQKVRDMLTDQIDTVINCTLICVKIKSKLTKLMKISRIEGYNGKYGSNPHGIRKISDDLFKFDQIRQCEEHLNLIELLLNALQMRRTSQFIGHLGITVR